MTETKVKISSSCYLIRQEWEGYESNVCLEYIEHSPDAWHSNSETSIDLDAAMAQQIVKFLTDSFPEISTTAAAALTPPA